MFSTPPSRNRTMKTTKSRSASPRQNRHPRLGTERLEERTLMVSGLEMPPFAPLGGALAGTRGLDSIPAQVRPSGFLGEGEVQIEGAGTDARQRQARRELVRLH